MTGILVPNNNLERVVRQYEKNRTFFNWDNSVNQQ